MLESGKVKSLKEIAERENIDNSYVSRMVNLTCLAPDIVAAILEDQLLDHITLFELAVDLPVVWEGCQTASKSFQLFCKVIGFPPPFCGEG